MKFRTELNPDKSDFLLDLSGFYFFIGSCFSENIGLKLKRLGLDVAINPFGTIYNPQSIAVIFSWVFSNEKPKSNRIIKREGVYFHLDVAQDFFGESEADLMLKIDSEIIRLKSKVNQKPTYTFVTLGTAVIYNYTKDGEIVANCHKLPAIEFERDFLNLEQINKALRNISNLIFNPNKLIVTLSPVRHTKETLVGNSLSKSLLRVGIESILKKEGGPGYFPAFEIFIDDLRDYRFANEDLVHPNIMAVNYIWDKFKEAYFSKASIEILSAIEKTVLLYEHKLDKTKWYAANPDIIITHYHKLFNQVKLLPDWVWYKTNWLEEIRDRISI